MKRLMLLSILFSAFITKTVLAADVDGSVAWSQRVDLSTTVSGLVHEVLVNAGDRVNKGDVLLRLQADRFNAALASAKAAEKDAQYKLKEAEREWNRAQELYERTVLSDSDLQQAENLLVAAQAASVQATTQRINAKRDVVESVIRAPFDAVVLQRHVEPGQSIVTRMQSVPMISVAATTYYHAQAAVSVVTANKLSNGQSISVTVGDKRFNGILTSVGYEPRKGTELYPVTVRFTTAGRLLRAGQNATIHLP